MARPPSPYYPLATSNIPTVPTQVKGGLNPWVPGSPLYMPVYGYPTSLMQDQNPNYPYVYVSVIDSVTKYTIQFVIALPLPNTCKTLYGATWEELNLGLVANQVDLAIQGGQDWSKLDKDKFLGYAKNAAAEGALVGATNMAENTGFSEVAGAVARQMGYMINPHAAVLFKGMPFRELNFNWTLYPKNPQESTQIKSLIFALKWAMHPELSVGAQVSGQQSALNAAFLKYPLNFVIEVMAPHNKVLFRTSAMALLQCEVEYCGAGRPAFFQWSDDPVAINLTLAFKELEIITRSRIEEGW